MSLAKNTINRFKLPWLLAYLLKWLVISLFVGALAGSASAIFLIALDHTTQLREMNQWLIWLLPLGGLVIGLTYYYLGSDVVKGNNQLIDEFHKPERIIPLKMAPLVLFGTLATHLFGGSAGREGTAVQMGGAIADQFTRLFKLKKRDRRTIIITGISAGFASVFGTPLAGAVFAIEVLTIGRIRYEAILPSFLTAMVANYACQLWPLGHTHYAITSVPTMNLPMLLLTILAGIIFGLSALLFSKSAEYWSKLFGKIKYPPMRPVIGGAILAVIIWSTGAFKYTGLGVPVIVDAFTTQQEPYVFLLKILFTTFTLSAGFKGGEVTPLFFVGATLGSALSLVMPLPVSLLAGMGFVAVFAGATNTPIACILMGIELFGAQGAAYIAIACIMAYAFSGHTGIYQSQMIGTAKHLRFGLERGKRLNQIN